MTASGKNRKILVVEDDSDTLALIQHFLKDTAYEIITSRRGDVAYQVVRDVQPDLAIIDGLIPGIHGFELCQKIKDDPVIVKKPKIILMSSVYTAQKYKFEVVEFKPDAFMTKPFSKNDLLSKITELIT
ncbi:MAG TPA: response regulator [Thermodesulfovibrionales bacterium]|nr:response regulator [Thermodesulfovibrionales bacterium]